MRPELPRHGSGAPRSLRLLAACLCRVQKAEVEAAASEALAVQKVEVEAGVRQVEAEVVVATSEVLAVLLGVFRR